MSLSPANDRRLLVVTLSNIGDLVLTTPVFEALAQNFPGVPIDVLGDARSIELLRAAPYAGEFFVRAKRAGWLAQWQLLRRMRRRRYEVIVDLRTPVLPWLLRARHRCINRRSTPADIHAVLDHYAVIRALVEPVHPPLCRLYVAADAAAVAARMTCVLSGKRWLAVAPGANWPGKKWPSSYFRELLILAKPYVDGVIVLGSAADASDCTTLQEAGLPMLETAGATSLTVAAALIARASLFIGNDSGLGHVAAALGVPSLTLFGHGRPQRYRPWGEQARVIMAPQAKLSLLEPKTVLAELTAALNRIPVPAP